MILKAVTTILLLGLLATMVLRAVLPRPRAGDQRKRVETATKCPDCGAYRLGDGECPTLDCPSRR